MSEITDGYKIELRDTHVYLKALMRNMLRDMERELADRPECKATVGNITVHVRDAADSIWEAWKLCRSPNT